MGASNLKGINVQLGAETTGIEKALTGVNKTIRESQFELRAVERLLKLDPGNTELVAQKQAILAKQVEATKEKLLALKSTQAQVEQQFKSGEIGAEKHRAFQREIVKTETELKKLEAVGKETGEGLAKSTAGASKGLDDLNMKAVAAGGAMVAAGDKINSTISGAIKDTQAYVSEIVALQRMTGLSAEEASKMTAVLQRFGVEGKSVGTIIKTLSQAINSQSKELAAAGIATQNADGSNRTSMEVLADLADYYSKAEDKTAAVALASKVMGRNWQALLPVLAGGKSSIEAITKAAEENGAIYSQDQIDQVRELTKAQKDNTAALEAFTNKVGVAAAPLETFKAETLGGLIDMLNKLSPTLAAIAVSIISAIGWVVASGGRLLLFLAGLKFFLPGVYAALQGLGPAIAGIFTGAWSSIAGFFAGLPALLGTFAAWVAGLTGAAAAGAVAIAVALGVALGVGIDKALRAIFPNYQQWWNDMLQPVFDFNEKLILAIMAVIPRIQAWGASVLNTVGTLRSDMVRGVSTFGSQIVEGIKQGLVNSWAGLKTKFFDLLSQLPQWAKNILGIASPSKVFAEIGKNMTLGMEVGLKVGIPDVEAMMSDLTARVTATAARLSAINVNMGIADPGAYGARGSRGYGGPLVAAGAVQVNINGNVAPGEGKVIAQDVNGALKSLARELGIA